MEGNQNKFTKQKATQRAVKNQLINDKSIQNKA